MENPVLDILSGTDPVVDWLFPDLIARGSLIVLAGEPGAGKSFLCYALGMAAAAGISLLGFTPPHAFRILYFDQENSRPDRDQYLRWAWRGVGAPDLSLIATNFWTRHFELGTSDWFTRAVDATRAVQPDLIFLDTATPCCAITDENDNGIATHVINRLRSIQAITTPPAALIVLKHARIYTETSEHSEPQRTIRGAKAWAGAADAVWFHVRAVGRPRTGGLANTHLSPAKTRAFGLREVVHIRPDWTAGGLQLSRIDP